MKRIGILTGSLVIATLCPTHTEAQNTNTLPEVVVTGTSSSDSPLKEEQLVGENGPRNDDSPRREFMRCHPGRWSLNNGGNSMMKIWTLMN
jgi:hypothetical protein